MELQLYERPREKLHYKGAKSLSQAELFQILIGSGTPKYHVAKIAREVVKLLEDRKESLGYNDLKLIKGLGQAKICQILAVLELCRRHVSLDPLAATANASFNVETLKKAKRQLFVYETYDGQGALIKRRQLATLFKDSRSLIRRIAAEVITDNAARISFALGSSLQHTSLNEDELVFLKTLTDSVAILQVSINTIILVDKQHITNIKSEIL